MAILVTGATGFVGCNSVEYLARQGHDILALDVAPPDAMVEEFWGHVRERIHFVPCDITCTEEVEHAVRSTKVDTMVHAAAMSSASSAQPEGLQRTFRVIVLGTVAMLDVARSLPALERFLYISSAAVYGPASESTPVMEELALKPASTYALAKCASEALVRYAEGKRGSVTILRLGWIYGPMERPTWSRSRMSTIWELCHRAKRGEQIRINDVEAIRDWTHGEDVGKAIHLLLAAKRQTHLVYNLSSGVGYPTKAVLSLLEEQFPDLSHTLVPSEQANVRIDTANRRGPLDIARLRDDVGFQPTYELSSGLKAYLAWLHDTEEKCEYEAD